MLEWTGERYLPYSDTAITGVEIHYEHLHRYAFASQFVENKIVLDLASGEGYGSYLLSKKAKSVIGIEIDSNAVNHAQKVYFNENLEFKKGDILDIPIKGEKKFDVIICFEAIEHVKSPEKAFSEIYRVLKPGGYHIFTIPYHENKPTLNRMMIKEGEDIKEYLPVYHGDPLRKEGVIVYTDFGYDMKEMVNNIGFSFEAILCNKWYSLSEIPYIDNEKEYHKYLKFSDEGNMLKYFKYNSWVFRLKKEV